MGDLDNAELRISTLERDSERNNETHRLFYSKFEKVNAAIIKLDADIDVRIRLLAGNVAAIMPTLQEIKDDLRQIKSKPGKRGELVLTAILTAATTALVTYIVTSMLRGA